MSRPGDQLIKRMEKALLLNERFGLACLNDPETGRLLRNLRELICRTDSAMLQSGVASACTGCAGSKGSCCFREMGESYGSIGLFVNLLPGPQELSRGANNPQDSAAGRRTAHCRLGTGTCSGKAYCGCRKAGAKWTTISQRVKSNPIEIAIAGKNI